ncbi:MAG: hypothetical protein WC876_10805 [Candidatus Thermoplasmatota archaeon]
MRSAFVLLVLASSLALTGCVQGGPDDDFGTPTCPSWTKGRNAQIVSPAAKLLYSNQTTAPDFDRWDFTEETYYANGTVQTRWGAFGSPYATFSGRPLDFIVFDFAGAEFSGGRSILFVQDAEVKLLFFAANEDGSPGELLPSWDTSKGQASAQDEWTFRSDPAKGFAFYNVTLRVDLAQPDDDPNPRGVFAYWTWVFDLDHDRDTPSLLYTGYSPEFWYRSCSKDGTTF